jgi:hypothetical protein
MKFYKNDKKWNSYSLFIVMKDVLIVIEILDRLLECLDSFLFALVFLYSLLEHIRELAEML